jgi:hypothetical protein
MANTRFMESKYTFESLVANYANEIKNLRPQATSAIEETKLQNYYQAASVFKRVSLMDIVQFALAFGRGFSGRSAEMRDAFSIILGNRVNAPSHIDLVYARLLQEYTRAFKLYRTNIKDWLLWLVLASRYSPLQGWIDREIDNTIAETQSKITAYEALI